MDARRQRVAAVATAALLLCLGATPSAAHAGPATGDRGAPSAPADRSGPAASSASAKAGGGDQGNATDQGTANKANKAGKAGKNSKAGKDRTPGKNREAKNAGKSGAVAARGNGDADATSRGASTSSESNGKSNGKNDSKSRSNDGNGASAASETDGTVTTASSSSEPNTGTDRAAGPPGRTRDTDGPDRSGPGGITEGLHDRVAAPRGSTSGSRRPAEGRSGPPSGADGSSPPAEDDAPSDEAVVFGPAPTSPAPTPTSTGTVPTSSGPGATPTPASPDAPVTAAGADPAAPAAVSNLGPGPALGSIPLDSDVTRAVESMTERTQRVIRDLRAADLPARDLGVPAALLALVGAYLAGLRWLDRGGLPMVRLEDGRGDDVQLIV